MSDLVERAHGAVTHLDALCRQVGDHLKARSAGKLDAIQPEALGLARALALTAAGRAMVAWARPRGSHEQALAAHFTALAAGEVGRWVCFNEAALGAPGLDAATRAFVSERLAADTAAALGRAVLDRESEPMGALGLDAMHQQIRTEFGRFADAEVAPVAEHIHRHDALIPERLLRAMADLGVFGISIPEEWGGNFMDHRTMIIATEELSRGSLGAGGSVITRPEICAKAILKGGTEAQKSQWLPALAAGKRLISVAVTEPDAGSDVARVMLAARRTEGGYLLSGEKTWCTFAGRADVLCVLARTGSPDDGHRGLTLFLVEKPATTSEDGDDRSFEFVQPGGGRIAGKAIPTIGYRGMHSFSVSFDDVFVPDSGRVGDEGQGFYLQMAGFAGGRIQTAARAVGVMEAAFREATRYARDRKVFGKALADFPLTQVKVAEIDRKSVV